MPKFWRIVTPLAAAGGLIAVGAIPAASASAAAATSRAASAYAITIRAHSNYPVISGHTLVIYKNDGTKTKDYRTATISGTVTGAGSTDVATLWSEPFGAEASTATTSTVALKPSTADPTQASYSFTVTPGQATAYEVQVTTPGVTTPDVISSPATVYVAMGDILTSKHQKCTRTTCTFSYRAYERVPAGSSYRVESRKKWHLYLAVGYSKLPKYFTLSTTARASKVKQLSTSEFFVTFTWHVRLHNGGGNWTTTFCTKDTESTDGIGLPGNHGCGNRKVSIKTDYLG